MWKYDPNHHLDGAKWLALDEGLRLAAVRRYHQRVRAEVPNLEAHAVFHTIVENQLAEDLPQAKDALTRLLGEGLDRHEAIHAIASVMGTHIWNLTNNPSEPGDPHAPYLAALEKLTVESWHRSCQDEE